MLDVPILQILEYSSVST